MADLEMRHTDLEEDTLHDTRISPPRTSTNPAPGLAPANTLPCNVLKKIFTLSRTYCAHDADGAVLYYNTLAEVNTHWRQVAITMPSLWNHIDIAPSTPARSFYAMAETLVKRTEGILVHMHILEPSRSPEQEIQKFIRFLGSLVHRVRLRTLRLDTQTYSRSLIKAVIELWMNGDTSTLEELYVYRPDGTELRLASHYGDTSTNLSEGQDRWMSSLQVLHLHSTRFGWDSPVYHGLVDLRIQVNDYAEISISVSKLANVLAMSPKLTTLKLWRVKLLPSQGWDAPTPIVLECLQVLGLTNLWPLDGARHILPLIAQPNPSAQLCIGMTQLNHAAEEFEAFASRSHIDTLYCEGHCLTALLQAPPLKVSSIVLNREFFIDTGYEHVPPLPERASFAHVSRLTLLWCAINLERLAKFIVDRGIRVLRLEACLIQKREERSCYPLPLDIQPELLAACPGLECTISNTDSSRNLPCRFIFDHCAEDYMGEAQVPGVE